MYQRHPSEKLNSLFLEKPYQGVFPGESKFLFVGLDANYAADIESQTAFDKVIEYHSNGVSFWQKYKVHHPFLLEEYKGDGRKYHRNFARIGFQDKDAASISFIELLHLPSVGRNKLEMVDLSDLHLAKVNDWIINSSVPYVFISAGVASLMRKSKRFSWMPENPRGIFGNLKVFWQSKDKVVFSHLHFSNYGKFEEQMRREAQTIRELA